MHIAYFNGQLFVDREPAKFIEESSRQVFKFPGGMVMKIERDHDERDHDFRQNEKEARFLKAVSRRKDAIYFPELYAQGELVDEGSDRDVTWILVQEINFSKRDVTREDEEIVYRLRIKYNLYDIGDGHNWSINRQTDLPVIFDTGLNGY